MHAALVGDSIFDNRAYTAGEPDVVSHLRTLLPDGWQASLLAVDGSTIDDVAGQLSRVPRDATHVIVSAGGNDALLNSDVLSAPAASVADAIIELGARVERFERAYRGMLARVAALRRETILCTIYNGNLEGPWGRAARHALTMFNDAILRAGVEHGHTLIELRLVCDRPEDYANPIEPSDVGGRKIAGAIFRALARGSAGGSRVIGGAAGG
jgi:hypothetical protein